MLNILGPISNLAGKWMEGRQKKAELKTKLEQAKIEGQIKRAASDAAWEEKAMDASASSWKDELWTVFFVGLLCACFYPPAQPYIADGFRFLREDCPEWLSWGILVSIGASFGFKYIGALRGN
jgi:hypothetical protein